MEGQKRGHNIPSFDNIFGITKEIENEELAKEISLDKLHSFEGHPFRVLDDASMQELVKSVKEQGVIIPILARPTNDSCYEIIYGHRRKRACELAGLNTVPTIIKDMNDKEAIEIMVDTNIQREGLLVSEKAFAYAMKYKQISKQGCRTDLTNENIGIKLLKEKEGESIRTIQRYISLTKLLPELLELIDQKKINFMAGVEIASIDAIYQDYLLQVIREKKVFPKKEESEKLKKYAEKGELTRAVIESVLEKEKTSTKKITFQQDKLQQYFPKDFTAEEKENIVYELLEEWKNKNFDTTQ